MWILQRVARRAIAAHDVVVQHRFNVPSDCLGHLGEMRAAVEALLFAGHSQEDDRSGETMLAEHPRALQTDGGSTGIVIGSRRLSSGVGGIAVAGIVMPGHHIHSAGICRIGAAQDSVNIRDRGGLRNSRPGRLQKLVCPHFQAIAALAGNSLQLALDPDRRRVDAFVADRRHVRRRASAAYRSRPASQWSAEFVLARFRAGLRRFAGSGSPVAGAPFCWGVEATAGSLSVIAIITPVRMIFGTDMAIKFFETPAIWTASIT